MKIKQSQKRWLIAFILVVVVIFVVEWLMSRNRTKANRPDTIQNSVK